MLGIFVGVSGFTFHYAKGTSYLSENPKACANCHIMQDHLDSWNKSSHHNVASCVDCHLPSAPVEKWIAKMENGYHHSKAFTLNNYHEPIQMTPKNSKILQQNCLSCHANLTSSMSPGHPKTTNSLSCVRCHAGVGHGASN